MDKREHDERFKTFAASLADHALGRTLADTLRTRRAGLLRKLVLAQSNVDVAQLQGRVLEINSLLSVLKEPGKPKNAGSRFKLM